MSRHLVWIGLISLTLWIASCGADGSGVDPGQASSAGTGGASTTGGGSAPTPPPDAALFFEGSTIPEIRITLSPAAMNGLNADAKTYVPGDVEVRFNEHAVALGSVGIRL